MNPKVACGLLLVCTFGASAVADQGRMVETARGLQFVLPSGWASVESNDGVILVPPAVGNAPDSEMYLILHGVHPIDISNQDQVRTLFDRSIDSLLPGGKRTREAFVPGARRAVAILNYEVVDRRGILQRAVIFCTSPAGQSVTLACVGTAASLAGRLGDAGQLFSSIDARGVAPGLASRQETPAAAIPAPAPAATAPNVSLDRNLVGTWTKNWTEGGNDGQRWGWATFEIGMRFYPDGTCQYCDGGAVSAGYRGYDREYDDDLGPRGNVRRGRWSATAGTIDIQLEDGTHFHNYYSFFEHNGVTMLKFYLPGQKPTYFYPR